MPATYTLNLHPAPIWEFVWQSDGEVVYLLIARDFDSPRNPTDYTDYPDFDTQEF